MRIKAEEILFDIYSPKSKDLRTYREDLQLAIKLNPSLDLILQAMIEFGRLCAEEQKKVCAENAKIKYDYFGFGFDGKIDKDSILNSPNIIDL